MAMRSQRLKILSWHIHGSYLYHLSQGNFDIFLPVDNQRSGGYSGRGNVFPFGVNVHEVPAGQVKDLSFDVILFQNPKNFLSDQFEILSEQQRALPRLYLEHDPPHGIPSDTRHIIDDPEITLVHVTHFNKLMWDNGRTPAVVIEPGVKIPTVQYSGELERGVVISHTKDQSRRLGWDIFLKIKKYIPLDVINIGNEKTGGSGEILHQELPAIISKYRFLFDPARYTSLEFTTLEAMMMGMPIAGLATTEQVTVLRNRHSGIIHSNISLLIKGMKDLLEDKILATHIGNEGRKTAMKRFHVNRFIADWEQLLNSVIEKRKSGKAARVTKEVIAIT